MSNKNIFWLFIGIVIGVIIYEWCMQQMRIAAALANHNGRLMALEDESRQRAIVYSTPKDKIKWAAGFIILALSAIRLVVMVVHLCGHWIRF